jgi:hypothetical protein
MREQVHAVVYYTEAAECCTDERCAAVVVTALFS